MKTRALTTSLVIFLALSINAKTQVTMYDVKGHLQPNNSGVPIVNTDGDDVTIMSDSTLYNVDVVIRDQYGNVMHHTVENIGPMETTISIPEGDGMSEKTTIELYYDRRHLRGTFDE